jgi:NTE family protein
MKRVRFCKARIVIAAMLMLQAISWSQTMSAEEIAVERQPSVQGETEAAVSNPRPKICLVLSGGGARGAAHVGVLKVLEELRVPVDCIVGTSMGSLVGAAYATGTTLSEIDEIVAGISTELLFNDAPPRKDLAMRRKQDDYTILFGPEMGVSSDGLALGKGVVSGVQLESVLRRLSKEKGYHQFDNLPIQYRAVATNLVSGKEVVFSEGDLANVMRASMSVPGAVAPAEQNGYMLVDGMLTRNLPVETARELGADIIIAVNVGTPLLERHQLNGILGVTGQMLSILTEQNVQVSIASLKPDDILILPELTNYSTSDFDSLSSIVPLGEIAARKAEDRLRKLAISEADYAALRMRQQFRVSEPPPPVDEIRFLNLHRVNPDSVLAVMRTKPGKPIIQDELDGDMRRLYGTGDFEHVSYRYLQENDKHVMIVDAVEKSWGPDYLRFGLGLSSDFEGDAYFNVLTSYRKTWLNSLGAEWRTDVQFGQINRLTTEFYQPLSTDRFFFIAPHLLVSEQLVDVYDDDLRIGSYEVLHQLAGLDLGTHFYQYGELRLGVVGGNTELELDTGSPKLTAEEDSVRQGAFTANLLLDQLNSIHFPRSGWRVRSQVFNSNSSLGADESYTRVFADTTFVYSLKEHTFNLSLTAGDSIGSNPLPYYDQFQWGGFLRQSGYATDQFIGGRLQFGRLMYYHRILRGSIFEGAYSGISLEAGKMEDPLVEGTPEDWRRSGSVFLAADSILGPAYLAYGLTEDGQSSVYFYLGIPY